MVTGQVYLRVGAYIYVDLPVGPLNFNMIHTNMMVILIFVYQSKAHIRLPTSEQYTISQLHQIANCVMIS